MMFITLLLQPRLMIAQAWTTSCTSEQRGELASVQGPGPTEGADRKEERTTVDERERERREISRGRLVLARYSILYLSHSLIPSSSCTVHSFVRPLLAPSLSLSLFLARAHTSHPFLTLFHFLSLSYTRA